jgi:LmbE family N-acetylglucosaminyl deacetylase
VTTLMMLGHPDFELDQLPPGKLREQYIRLVRLYKPDIVMAEDAIFINEVHPDHKAVAIAASDAVSFSHLPLIYPHHLSEGLSPHFVVEKYFFSDNLAAANKIVDISTTFERKIEALGEHSSQVEFLVEEIFMQARLAGVNVAELLGEAALDPLATIRWALQAQAVEIGKSAGYQYAEGFRYTRFHPYIEGILQAQGSALDERAS